ncbi:type II restriction endonuclease [Roseateles sp. NT4]|uniref:type II restriction endonuclease n=1 Tax=Roseateles sp. NT4 TaxID=3453715 RepID=UPI003EECC104
MTEKFVEWLRDACKGYEVKPYAIYHKVPHEGASWPLVANDADELAALLQKRGHFSALPKESAALANVLEVSIVGYLLDKLKDLPGAVGTRGGERAYPDLEVSGDAFGGGIFAVDVKVARRATNGKQTHSRISLYTGNTFFKYPKMKWPGTFRPFGDYTAHISLLVIYTLDTNSLSRVTDLEVIVQESWKVASKQRSSTTREYLGAVLDLKALREGRGEFSTRDEFYKYWRAYGFKVGRAVANQLAKLTAEQAA